MALLALRLRNTKEPVSVNTDGIRYVQADFSSPDDFEHFDGAKLAKSTIYLTIWFRGENEARRVVTIDRFGREDANIADLDLAIENFTEAANNAGRSRQI